MNIGIILVGSFFLLLCLRVPVAASMGIASVLGMVYAGYGVSMLATVFYSAIAKYSLLAIPFFILAGVIMDYAGISKRLINFINACVGHTRGGLAVVTVIVACFFAAISGSGPATVAAIGGVLIPAMQKNGYDKNFATAIVASSGGIGMVIPPSIPFVIYAMLAEQSVGTMFMAGIIPGILMGVAFSVTALIYMRNDKNVVTREKASDAEIWKTFKDAIWGILAPVIILGGIYGGVFTPTEAAGVAVVYALLVGVFIYKEIDLKAMVNMFKDAAVSSGIIMYIMGTAGAFTWILTTTGIAGKLSNGLLGISDNGTVLMLIMMLIFMIAGCFVDSASGFYLFLPILLPVVKDIEFSVYAFGVLATVNFAIGQITPPVGSNLFVACNIANVTMKDLVSRVWPFLLAGCIVLILMVFFPVIITGLPTLLGLS